MGTTADAQGASRGRWELEAPPGERAEGPKGLAGRACKVHVEDARARQGPAQNLLMYMYGPEVRVQKALRPLRAVAAPGVLIGCREGSKRQRHGVHAREI